MTKKILLSSGVVVFMLAIAVGNFLRLSFRELKPMAPFWDMEIAQGETAGVVVDRLAARGIRKHPHQFRLYLKLSGREGDIQAGTATIYQDDSFASIVDALTSADVWEVQMTIPEGFTVAQIGTRVRETFPSITQEGWDAAAKGTEGYLFPDTYRFAKDATAQEIVTRMKETSALRVVRLGVPVEKDDIILASIVEREVRKDEDRRMVADIFLKRLEIGMALQADSTVNYATGKANPSATYADIKIDSPYNTYKYRGLPPAPISNPGYAAIFAVLHPIPNDYYYFLTTPSGEVKYARTLAEHNANRQYLK